MSTKQTVLGVLKWLGIGLGVILLLVAGVLVFFLTTTAGARTAIHFGLSKSPYRVQVASIGGSLRGPLTLSGIDVDYEGIRAHVAEFVLDWRPLALLRRDLAIDVLHATGIEVDVPEGWAPPPKEEPAPPKRDAGPPTVPELPVDVRIEDLRVELVRLLMAGKGEVRETVLAGHGSLEDFAFTAEVQGQAAPIETFQASLSLDGAPDAWRLGGDVGFTSTDMPPVTATLASAGSLTGLDVEEASVRTANGRAELTAEVSWYPEIVWSLLASADGFEVAPFTPEPEQWPGQVSFRAESSGRLADAGPQATVLVQDIGGELRGQPLGGGVDARVEPGRVDVNEMDVTWGALALGASGAMAETLAFTFEFDAPDLSENLPNMRGAVRASGTIEGTKAEPKVAATFTATDVALDSTRLASAEGTVALDLSPGAINDVDVRAAGLTMGATTVDSIALTLDGTRERHAARLGAWLAGDRIAVALSGALEGGPPSETPPVWTGALDTLAIDAERTGIWSLRAAAPIYATADTASVGEACLVQDASALCLAGGWRNAGAAAGAVRIEALPLAMLAALPDGTTVDGTLEGDARFAMSPSGMLSADGEFRANADIASELGGEPARFTLGGEGVTLAIDDAGARVNAAFELQPQAGGDAFRLTAGVSLPGYNSAKIPLEEQPVEGTFEAVSEDLAFLSSFHPAVSEAEGRLHMEAGIAGMAAKPEIRGTLVVEDGRFVLPDLGLDLRDAQLNASGDPEGGIALTGSVTSGEGGFEIEGHSPVAPSAEQPAEIRMHGERFLAVNTSEAEVIIEPDLDITFDGELTTVRGRVAVPYANVELVELPPSAVPISPDVVFVGEEAPPPPQVDAQVELVVGDSVHFEGFGLRSDFEGELRITEEPGDPPLILGEMRMIDGRYAAYGQNLEIDPGRIVFSGPAADATLEITAIRSASDGTTAGVIVSGSATQPEVAITSDPSMSDADALAYIMYGKSMSDGNADEQASVAGAAASLGANVVTTKLASSVGLDDARIEGATKEQAELVAGKYLTPSLYVSYGLGLFKPSNTFRVKYLLSSRWAVQAESGEANGGDLLWQIERGK